MTFRPVSVPAAVFAALLALSAGAAGAQSTDGTLTEEDRTVAPGNGAEDRAEDGTEPGIWGVACDRDATGRTTGCRVTQTVVASDTGTRLLMVTVRRTPDKDLPSLVVTAPLRTFLVPGTLIQVDSKPGWKVSFQLCDESGCYAGVSLDEGMVGMLKDGETLAVEYYDRKRRKTTVRLPLKNFAKSFDDAAATN